MAATGIKISNVNVVDVRIPTEIEFEGHKYPILTKQVIVPQKLTFDIIGLRHHEYANAIRRALIYESPSRRLVMSKVSISDPNLTPDILRSILIGIPIPQSTKIGSIYELNVTNTSPSARLLVKATDIRPKHINNADRVASADRAQSSDRAASADRMQSIVDAKPLPLDDIVIFDIAPDKRSVLNTARGVNVTAEMIVDEHCPYEPLCGGFQRVPTVGFTTPNSGKTPPYITDEGADNVLRIMVQNNGDDDVISQWNCAVDDILARIHKTVDPWMSNDKYDICDLPGNNLVCFKLYMRGIEFTISNIISVALLSVIENEKVAKITSVQKKNTDVVLEADLVMPEIIVKFGGDNLKDCMSDGYMERAKIFTKYIIAATQSLNSALNALKIPPRKHGGADNSASTALATDNIIDVVDEFTAAHIADDGDYDFESALA
jgi:hypothetical protein